MDWPTRRFSGTEKDAPDEADLVLRTSNKVHSILRSEGANPRMENKQQMHTPIGC
jgi:N-acetylmuramoyl-L-alanine amidase